MNVFRLRDQLVGQYSDSRLSTAVESDLHRLRQVLHRHQVAAQLMLPKITICVWIGLPKTAEHSATKVASGIAVVGTLLCSSTTWKW